MDEHIAIDPRIVKEEKIARETLSILLKTKQKLDEVIENLEILTDQELLESINKSARAKKRGETGRYISEKLKRELQLTDEDPQKGKALKYSLKGLRRVVFKHYQMIYRKTSNLSLLLSSSIGRKFTGRVSILQTSLPV